MPRFFRRRCRSSPDCEVLGVHLSWRQHILSNETIATWLVPRRTTMRRYLATAAFILAALMAAAPMAFAQLERMGPISTSNGYPTWFQDNKVLAVEFCSTVDRAELAGASCLLVERDPPAAEVFANEFFAE